MRKANQYTRKKKENCVWFAMITKDFQDTKTEKRFSYSFTYVFWFIEFVKLPPWEFRLVQSNLFPKLWKV